MAVAVGVRRRRLRILARTVVVAVAVALMVALETRWTRLEGWRGLLRCETECRCGRLIRAKIRINLRHWANRNHMQRAPCAATSIRGALFGTLVALGAF